MYSCRNDELYLLLVVPLSLIQPTVARYGGVSLTAAHVVPKTNQSLSAIVVFRQQFDLFRSIDRDFVSLEPESQILTNFALRGMITLSVIPQRRGKSPNFVAIRALLLIVDACSLFSSVFSSWAHP